MSLLPSVKTKITVEASRYRSAVSEFLLQTIGKTVNYLCDKTDDIESTIEGAVFTNVTPVYITSFPYTVPADNFLVAVGYATNNVASEIQVDAVTKARLSTVATTTEYQTKPFQAAAGQVVSKIGSGTCEFQGFLITSATLTIP